MNTPELLQKLKNKYEQLSLKCIKNGILYDNNMGVYGDIQAKIKYYEKHISEMEKLLKKYNK